MRKLICAAIQDSEGIELDCFPLRKLAVAMTAVSNQFPSVPLLPPPLATAPVRRLGIATAYAQGTRYKVYWALVMSD
ncbi:MAG: hypothetical protein ACLQIQ_00600 [Beijerinckiaceae bacterium]